jgi:hypothetical protein
VKFKDDDLLPGDEDDGVIVAVLYHNGDRRTTEAINSLLSTATEHNRCDPKLCLIFFTNETHPEYGNRLEQVFRRAPNGGRIPTWYPVHVLGQAVNVINAVPRMLPTASNERIAHIRKVAFDEKTSTLAAALPDVIEAFGADAVRLPDLSLTSNDDILTMSLLTWQRLVNLADDFESFIMTPDGMVAFPPPIPAALDQEEVV